MPIKQVGASSRLHSVDVLFQLTAIWRGRGLNYARKNRTNASTQVATSGPDAVLLRVTPATPPLPVDPLHSDVPALPDAEIAAIYHGQRVAGDFYEFLRVGSARVLFELFDIAGPRQDTRQILIAAQGTFRTLAPQFFRCDRPQPGRRHDRT